MSIWSTSTGRNSVFGAEDGAVLPSSHLPIHVHVARTHLRNADGHCFHKRFHDCQVGSSPLVSLILQFVSFLSLSGCHTRYYTVIIPHRLSLHIMCTILHTRLLPFFSFLFSFITMIFSITRMCTDDCLVFLNRLEYCNQPY